MQDLFCTTTPAIDRVSAASSREVDLHHFSPTAISFQIQCDFPIASASTAAGGLTLHFAICVPARDEGPSLPALFAALDGLVSEAGDRMTLCLLLDGCSDASFAIASACAGGSRYDSIIEQAPGGPCNAGRARGMALDIGIRVLGDDDGLLLSTDADSIPADDWLVTMAEGLKSADLVAGAVRRTGDRICPVHDRLAAYLDGLFALRRRIDPVPWEAIRTHHYASGANLGMRVAALNALGGLQPLPSGEDARLLDDASRAGLRVRRDAECLVSTSDRRGGRATAGFAHTLDWLDGVRAGEVMVAHPGDAAWQYRRHALARGAYDRDRLDEAAGALLLTLDHVRGVARDCPNAEAFAMRIVPEPPCGTRAIPLPDAEIVLASFYTKPVAA